MGVALYPEHGDDASELLKCADVAMYMAKRTRDDYAVYDPQDDQHNPDRLELLQELRTAIQQETMSVAFQPKFDLRSARVTGMEALARWIHPERTVVPPYAFIPVLEHTGLIKPFTLQILDKAAAFCKQCLDKGYQLSVAVNLSAHNLRDPNLPEQVEQILARNRLEKRFLTLEITESAIMHEPQRSLEILNALDRMGVFLSVDDFGTGYSSLSYLKTTAGEATQDRSFLCQRHDRRPGRCHDRAQHHRSGPQPGTFHGRRRRRIRGSPDTAGGHGLRYGPGLPDQPPPVTRRPAELPGFG